jgi:hypothetical protein
MAITNNGKNWIDSILSQFMGGTECPEFNLLVGYHEGSASSKIGRQIEKHLLDCELCSSVVESLPLVGDLSKIGREVELVNDRLRDYNKAEGMAALSLNTLEKKLASIRRRSGRLQPILGSPAFRYSIAAAFLIVVLYSVAMQYLMPQYYEVATLSSEERNMLLLFTESKRGDVQSGGESSEGALLLLSADQKRWWLLPSFDQEKVQQATSHLHAAFESSTEPFYRNKYAYFIGKAYLMQTDAVNARQWLETVVNAPSSKAYHQAASRLLKRLQ